MEILKTQGVKEERCRAKVRYGLVLDEILAEVDEGDYDLIVIGAHQVPEDQPWSDLRRVLQLDMADQLLTHIHRPVLVVRTIHDLELPAVESFTEDRR
jgi:nucleotide-binding universal stress UspA family protein